MSGHEGWFRRDYAHTNLLHVTVTTPISKLSANREIVEVMGPEVFARSGSKQL